MNNISQIFITAIVFYGIYQIISLISVHLLKRKLIKAEQYERVSILENPNQFLQLLSQIIFLLKNLIF
jgi:hypothetical protein